MKKEMNTCFIAAMMMPAVLLLGMGCSSEPVDVGGGSDGDADADSDVDTDASTIVCDEGPQAEVCMSGPAASPLTLTDKYNYSFSSDIQIGTMPVISTADLYDLTFDWSALTTGILKNPVNPMTDVDMIIVSLWNSSLDDLEHKIDMDQLGSNPEGGGICFETDKATTTANLRSFSVCRGVSVMDPSAYPDIATAFNAQSSGYDPNLWTHLLLAKTGTDPTAENPVMMKSLTLSTDPNAAPALYLDDLSSTLAFDADLRNQKRIPMAQNNPALSVDWNYLTVNALGNTFIFPMITRVVVAHYPANVCQIEDDFLNLQTTWDKWYFEDLAFTVEGAYDLTRLKDEQGNAFSGISQGPGTWMFALFCTNCPNPAPWFMTVLQPC
jgi:hypothetical protein